MKPERVMEWAVEFIGCMDPELRNDSVIEAAFSHAENCRKELYAAYAERNAALHAVRMLAEKAAKDGCPHEATASCTVTNGREYGGETCVSCWKRWAGVDTANTAVSGGDTPYTGRAGSHKGE